MDDPLREHKLLAKEDVKKCLNPYCNGWSSKSTNFSLVEHKLLVLILIVMDDPLRVLIDCLTNYGQSVLILIVMDDPLRVYM